MRRSFWNRNYIWWKSRMRSCRLKLRQWKLLKLEMLQKYWLNFRASRMLIKKSCIKILQMSHWGNQASRNLRAENLQINQLIMSLKIHKDQFSLEHQNKSWQQLRPRYKLIYSWKTSTDILLRWWFIKNLILKWWDYISLHKMLQG